MGYLILQLVCVGLLLVVAIYTNLLVDRSQRLSYRWCLIIRGISLLVACLAFVLYSAILRQIPNIL